MEHKELLFTIYGKNRAVPCSKIPGAIHIIELRLQYGCVLPLRDLDKDVDNPVRYKSWFLRSIPCSLFMELENAGEVHLEIIGRLCVQ